MSTIPATLKLLSRSKALLASTPPVRFPLVVDCPSNRLNGRLTLQKGFNRAFRLSAFMSSSGRQRSYPIPPLLAQLAERTLKVSQMLVLIRCRPESTVRQASVLSPPICLIASSTFWPRAPR
jgi:hypothetical protein